MSIATQQKHNSEIEDTSYALGRINKSFTGFTQYDPDMKFGLALRMEAEKLKAENDFLKDKLEESEKYKETVGQAVHDIRTPLSILFMAVKMSDNLSEKERFTFTDSVKRIKKIAQEFLETSKDKSEEKKQEKQHVLVSQVLQDAITQKTIQYNDKNVEFKYSPDASLCFTFIYGNALNFERMMSNLINNSVEAFDGNKGTLKLEFSEDDKNVKIIIQDDGKGMLPETVKKLMDGESVSTTKQGGFGIGTSQIQKTIKEFKGTQLIESEQGIGTKITLTIPKTHCPWWFANKIDLNEGDTVVILDDDSSMFNLMEKVFAPYLNYITLKFFETGQETIDFINSFEEKNKLFLLADYELRKQPMNGLDVIKNSGIDRYNKSILMTNNYSDKGIQEKVCSLETKIIAKSILENIEIVFKKEHPASEVDVIVLEDNELFAETVSELLEKDDLKVKIYRNPTDFLSNLTKYNQNIKIIIDNYYDGDSPSKYTTGDTYAKELFEKGYKNVCLLTGVTDIIQLLSKYPNGTRFVKKGSDHWDERLLWECKRSR